MVRELPLVAEHEIQGMHETSHIYSAQTIPALQEVRRLLNKIRSEAKNNIMTDEAMLKATQGTKCNVTIVEIAAKNTANLIGETVRKVKKGSDLVTRTNKSFYGVAKSAAKVGELVVEIVAASNEQSQGIGQVNTAVAEMDKVVQQNAASAEESASAAEEMNAQAGQMKNIVAEMVALVGGRRNGGKAYHSLVKTEKHAGERKKIETDQKGVRTKEVMIHKSREVNPDEVIPMENEDFKDF